MPWVKVPAENHPIFRAALPKDPPVETMLMFGGIAAKVNGHVFAGLFGRSTMVWLPEPDRATALALEGAEPFDPMGNGRVRSDKVMLPEALMEEPAELRRWIARAFKAAAALPAKTAKTAKTAKRASPKKAAAKKSKTPSSKKTAGEARVTIARYSVPIMRGATTTTVVFDVDEEEEAMGGISIVADVDPACLRVDALRVRPL